MGEHFIAVIAMQLEIELFFSRLRILQRLNRL
jgi:hypothetical protein